MRRLVALLSATVMLLAASSEARAEVRRFAIVIGSNHPHDRAGTVLRYADDDALSTHALLGDAGVRSVLLASLDADSKALFGEGHVLGPPRMSVLRAALATLSAEIAQARRSGFTTELLLFYSGHGDVERGEGFVVLEDGKLTRSLLFELLSSLETTRNHVFIDACKSYFVAFDRGPSGRRSVYEGVLARGVPSALENTGFVLSTSSDRESHEWERYQGGVLSHQLRSALRGAADANLDGRISYAELGAFLTTANLGISNPRFRPDFLVHPPARDFSQDVLTWQPSASSVSLRGDALGHVYLENGAGVRLLDVHAAPGEGVTVRVPDERPLFVRQRDGRAEYVIAAREPVVITALVPATLDIQPRGAVSLAFEQLFVVPFGARDVARFQADQGREERRRQASYRAQRRAFALRTAAGSVALGSLAAGLSISGLTVARYVQGQEGPAVERHRYNERLPRYSRAQAGLYASAAVFGALWLWTPLWDVEVAPSLRAAREGRDLLLGFGAEGRF